MEVPTTTLQNNVTQSRGIGKYSQTHLHIYGQSGSDVNGIEHDHQQDCDAH